MRGRARGVGGGELDRRAQPTLLPERVLQAVGQRRGGALSPRARWTKPFPNFANGELQARLLALLRAAGKCEAPAA